MAPENAEIRAFLVLRDNCVAFLAGGRISGVETSSSVDSREIDLAFSGSQSIWSSTERWYLVLILLYHLLALFLTTSIAKEDSRAWTLQLETCLI